MVQRTSTSSSRKRRKSSSLQFSSQGNDKPVLIVVFTCTLISGVILSQIAAARLSKHDHHLYVNGVAVVTMTLLSFIMIGVGCEFVIDKTNLRAYGKDYLIAMTAAGFPWLFVGAWFIVFFPEYWWGEALFMARFAAPTSAGILFTMLTAAGLTETWLFRKARILAIFDDLDTILFMVPLKVILSGLHWELLIDLALLSFPLVAAWRYMHKVNLPSSWPFKLLYAGLIVAFCKGLHYVSHHHLHMEPIHLEVLLPAFVVGCVLTHSHETPTEKRVATAVSAVFMLFVGLSTPPLTLSGEDSVLSWDMAGHIVVVTLLMVLGKMFPSFCYKDEADWQTRFALSLGMCPRGEVGAGIIVIAIEAGIKGPAIELAVVCLVINLVLSGAFVSWTKSLARSSERRVLKAREAIRRSVLEREAAKAKEKATEAMFITALGAFLQVQADKGSMTALLKITVGAWKDAIVLAKRKRERKKRKSEQITIPRRTVSLYLEQHGAKTPENDLSMT
jgi:Kef-type K+ transport system membrane component KefB